MLSLWYALCMCCSLPLPLSTATQPLPLARCHWHDHFITLLLSLIICPANDSLSPGTMRLPCCFYHAPCVTAPLKMTLVRLLQDCFALPIQHVRDRAPELLVLRCIPATDC